MQQVISKDFISNYTRIHRYSDSAIDDNVTSLRPKIELIDDHSFKYRVDFDNLHVDDSIAAICVSRPTNPTAML